MLVVVVVMQIQTLIFLYFMTDACKETIKRQEF